MVTYVHRGLWNNGNGSEGKEVAVKVTRDTARFEKDIMREIHNLQKLMHKNIVTLYGVFRYNGIGIILEYANCGSLYNYLHGTNFQAALVEKLNWMLQCANGMEYLHSKKTFHRDLKTQNLLLFDDYRTLKICDFGTVKEFATINTELKGTFGYMAPEVSDTNGKYTEKCDVFSFGIIFWELLSEKKPFNEFKDLNPLAIQNKIINGARPNINDIKSYKDSDCIKATIEKCWDRDPENRPTMKRLLSFIGIDLKLYIPLHFEDLEMVEIVGNHNAFFRYGYLVRKVQVKIIRSNNETVLDNLREIHNLKDLTHTNIVTLYGVSKDPDDIIYMIFEYAECGSLHHSLYFTEIGISIEIRLNWMKQFAQGLEYLHRKNILHRDLRTENLFLFDEYRQLKICNFGLVNEVVIPNAETMCYMAPELWGEARSEFTKECDVYSLGVIWFEIICRTNPIEKFKGLHPWTVASRINNDLEIDYFFGYLYKLKSIIQLCCSLSVTKRPTMITLAEFDFEHSKCNIA